MRGSEDPLNRIDDHIHMKQRKCLLSLGGAGEGRTRGRGRQGLQLVHFSDQTEPFWSLKPLKHPTYPTKKTLTSSREVDECKPLADGGDDADKEQEGPYLTDVTLEVGACHVIHHS